MEALSKILLAFLILPYVLAGGATSTGKEVAGVREAREAYLFAAAVLAADGLNLGVRK